jgi:3-ketosteroid 9alpha-monooxygenase subunit B
MTGSAPMAGVGPTLRDHRFHRLRVARVTRETADAVSLVLEIPDDLVPAFAYEAGQFCNLRVEIDGEPLVRCYSFSSAPGLDPEPRLTVKRVPGGRVSAWLVEHLDDGDLLDVSPPAGFFQLAGSEADLVAYAAGSGITPVLSLIRTALATTTRRVRLLYANGDRTGVIFGAELEDLRAVHGERLTVVHHLDDERGLPDARAVEAFLGTEPGGEHYVCGPAPFMQLVETTLTALGVDPGTVHVERFTPAEQPTPPPAPSDAGSPATARITIELDGRCETTDHRPGTTVLQTARQLGMSPPFSCESGSCATCMARLLEGSVTMFANNALTADEVDGGWILTCQSVPTTPTVHVVYGYDA